VSDGQWGDTVGALAGARASQPAGRSAAPAPLVAAPAQPHPTAGASPVDAGILSPADGGLVAVLAAFELEAAEGWTLPAIVEDTGLPALASSPLLAAPGAAEGVFLPQTLRFWAEDASAPEAVMAWGPADDRHSPSGPAASRRLPLAAVTRIGLIEEGRLDDTVPDGAGVDRASLAAARALADAHPHGLLLELDLGGRSGARLAVELWTASVRDRQRLSRAVVRLRAAARKAGRHA